MAPRFARPARNLLLLSLLAVALALPLAACVSVDTATEATPTASATSAAEFPVTLEAANGKVTIDERPERIVSLSPTATEMLFAIGAGDQVVAVDDQSDYPPEAPTTMLSGYQPNVEAVARYEPDLVVASGASGLKSLGDISIPLLVQPAAATLEGAYEQFEQLGAATGHASEAAEEVERIRSSIAEILATVPDFDEPPTFFHELDNSYFSVTSDTFIGQVYELVGLTNIADEADKAGTGYPQLSVEYIVDADPDLIFLADSECCDQTPERVGNRPGWDQISAVRNDAIVDVGDDVSSRWGPRVVDFLQTVVDAVKESVIANQ